MVQTQTDTVVSTRLPLQRSTRKIGFLGNNRFAEIGGRSMLDDADVVLCVPCSATWRAVFPDVCRPIFRSRFQPQPRHLGC